MVTAQVKKAPFAPVGRKPVDFSGRVFGKLTVKKLTGKYTKGKARAPLWNCVCECGKKIEVASYRFLHQNPKTSCGCANKGPPTIYKREYTVWQSMIARCQNTVHVGYKEYGGRGITVCEKWQKFEGFLEDMHPRPKKTTLDRKDPNGHYELDNCRWATNNEQAWNKRSTVYILHPETGERIPAAQLADEWGVSFQIMRYRMIKAGKWPAVKSRAKKEAKEEVVPLKESV